MPAAPTPDGETARLAALLDLGILDSSPDPEFDALVRAASLVCGVPVSLVSLVDAERQWFKANVGLPGVTETPRDLAFCAHAIHGDEILEIADAERDERFADNPLVLGDPGIRFYAGAPIRLEDGSCVGTLCVIDRVPRTLDGTQREVLRSLAAAAAAALESWSIRRRFTIAARALQTSEERVRRLYEGTPALMQSTGPDGTLVTVSDAWLARFGYTRAEVVGRPAWEIATHEEADAVRRAVLAVSSGAEAKSAIDFRAVAKNGEVVDITMSAVAEYDADGVPSLGLAILEDVTHEKKSLALLNRTGALSGVGGWELDLRTNALFWSAETYRIHGVASDYVPRLDEAIAFYEPDVRIRIRGMIDRAIADGSAWEYEHVLVRADGERIWVHAAGIVTFADGKPIRITGAIQDVTQRTRERRALERANERVRLATDSGGIGIWDWDVGADAIGWDAWLCRLYGMECESATVTYAAWRAYLHPEDAAAAERDVLDALRTGETFQSEFRIARADGVVRYISSSAMVFRDEAANAVRMVGTNRDVTRSRLLRRELSEQHELLRVTLRSIGDAVITTDAEGRVAWLNPVAERMTGWSSADAQGRPHHEVFRIVNEETREPAFDPVVTCMRDGRIVGLTNHTTLLSRSGDEYGIEDSAAPIRNDRGEMLGVVLVFHDVTEQRRQSGEMRYRASHDMLTGLVNREEFEARLRRVVHAAQEDGTMHALLYVDLDQFKIVNDTCGHAVGDLFLVQVANLLSTIVRTRGTLARLGGDEFAVILEHCTADQARRVAQQICDDMEGFRFTHAGKRFRIGASIGLVQIDRRWPTTAAILQAADTSCYAAKEAGRGRVHVWSESDIAMRARFGEMQWATRLEQALDEDGFILHAQRIVSLRETDALVRAEVLLRMKDTDGALIFPGAFLPAAERFHLMSRIDRWVLRHVIAWMRDAPSLVAFGCISINLSGQSVGDLAFHEWAMLQLHDAGPRICRAMCFEITETAAITNLADAAAFVTNVHELGVRVALDDFGAGASSFAYLKKLQVDSLKIDGQFIRNAVSDPIDEVAVRCFIDLARVVGLEATAEMVEDAHVLEHLRRAGADFAQGYLIHRPAPIDELLLVRTA